MLLVNCSRPVAIQSNYSKFYLSDWLTWLTVLQPQVVKLAVKQSHTNLGSEKDHKHGQYGNETSTKCGVGMRLVLNVEWEWGWC